MTGYLSISAVNCINISGMVTQAKQATHGTRKGHVCFPSAFISKASKVPRQGPPYQIVGANKLTAYEASSKLVAQASSTEKRTSIQAYKHTLDS